MPRTNKVILSLNAGELSPLMDARIDQQKYQAGCRTMENFLPLIHGGAERRPGTYYANEVKNSALSTRLVPFEYNVEQAYALEFGNQYIRFYRGRNTDAEAGLIVGQLLGNNPAWADSLAYINGDLVEYASVIYRCIWGHTSATGGGNGAGGEPDTNTTQWVAATLTADNYPIYEIVTPYLTADLFELKFEQSNDVMWITHTDYEPRTLSRISQCSFSLAEEAFEDGPFLDMNVNTAYTLSASATTGSITLTATGFTPFVSGTTAGHAPSGTSPTSKSLTGCLFKLVHANPEANVDKSFTRADDVSDVLEVPKGATWHLVTNGTWTGQIILQRSYDNWTTIEELHRITSQNNHNEAVTDEEPNAGADYRMISELGPFTLWTGTANCQLYVDDSEHIGIVEITAVTSSTVATATVIEELMTTDATHKWAEGYWSNYRGWPSCVTISPEERLTYAGSATYPLTVWGSKIGDYSSMDAGNGLDDEAIIFTLSGQGRQNGIRWILSRNTLVIGTEGGEWLLGASSDEEALTPTNVKSKLQSNYGSENIQAIIVNDAILFVQKGGRRVREMVYDYNAGPNGGYVADNLTIFSNHITESQIVDWAYQRSPDPCVWCVRGDGQIALMMYEREQNVFSWSRFITSDNTSESDFESVCVIGTPFEEDQAWVIVKRTIGGATKRYVEYFSTRGF